MLQTIAPRFFTLTRMRVYLNLNVTIAVFSIFGFNHRRFSIFGFIHCRFLFLALELYVLSFLRPWARRAPGRSVVLFFQIKVFRKYMNSNYSYYFLVLQTIAPRFFTLTRMRVYLNLHVSHELVTYKSMQIKRNMANVGHAQICK